MRTNLLQVLASASMAASGLIMPLYALQIGASTQSIGWIAAAFGLASFLSNLVFGRLGDARDRKHILQFGFLAGAVAFALQLLALTPTTYLLARAAAGFAVGIVPPTLAAYVYQIRRPLGKFTSYNAAGWLLASLLVVGIGTLATFTFRETPLEYGRILVLNVLGPYRTIFLLSSVLCLLGVVLTQRLPSMHIGLQVPLFPAKIVRNSLHVYLSIFVRNFGASGIWTIYPLYIVSLGGDLALVGWVHIVNMATQILVLRNVERLRRVGSARWLIGIGLVLSALTFWSFTFARTAVQLLPLQAPLGVSFACLWLGSLKEVMEHNVERATATGLLNGSLNLSNVAGPLWGAAVAAAFGFRATMELAALITVGAFVLYVVLARGHPAVGRPVPSIVAGPAGEVAP